MEIFSETITRLQQRRHATLCEISHDLGMEFPLRWSYRGATDCWPHFLSLRTGVPIATVRVRPSWEAHAMTWDSVHGLAPLLGRGCAGTFAGAQPAARPISAHL